MNLWRVPIDEATGQLRGEAEPVTVPSLWSGELSFSHDGTRLAYSSMLWRSTLRRIAFDAAHERTIGAPETILESAQPIRDHALSPDGQSIAVMQMTSQEDIALVRIDGTHYRRLTDDASRDRGPAWSPDGKEIAFYRDSGGIYQVWGIRPDGSGLRELVRADGALLIPFFSPDGTRMAMSFPVSPGRPSSFGIADLRASPLPVAVRPVVMPMLRDELFWPTSWSRGGKLAGVVVSYQGVARGLATYDLARSRLERAAGDGDWIVPLWLSDGRRLLVRDRRGIAIFDTATKAWHRLLDIGGYYIALSVDVSRDDRWITYTQTGTEGEIWLAELSAGKPSSR